RDLILAFANADDFARRLGLFKQVQVDQAVVKHNVGLVQQAVAHASQVRIFRSAADAEYGSDWRQHRRSPLAAALRPNCHVRPIERVNQYWRESQNVTQLRERGRLKFAEMND